MCVYACVCVCVCVCVCACVCVRCVCVCVWGGNWEIGKFSCLKQKLFGPIVHMHAHIHTTHAHI